MAIGTYAQLVTAITEWLARDNDATLVARIPDFITLCEAKLNRDLRSYQMEKRATADVNMSNTEPQYISLPTDFQMMRRIRITSVTGKPYLRYFSHVQAEEWALGHGDVAAQPVGYTVFGSEMQLTPTPDQAYTLEMIYRGTIAALTSINTTNWLLTSNPDIYLYGALLESSPYIKEDERLQVWATGFKYALDSLNQNSMDATYNAGPLTMSVTGATP